jgi:hypothetical protein
MKSNAFARLLPGLAILLFLILPAGLLQAQDTSLQIPRPQTFSNSHVFVGTQVPLQFTAGYGYRFSNRLSAQVQAGLITKPYSGFMVDAMETFGMDKYLARVIRKAFQNGVVFGVGPNLHFGNNYVGVYGQYMRLQGGGITPADALSIYFKKDFSAFDVNGLPVFEFTMQSNAVNAGALFGHRFPFRNPRLAMHGEVSLSKIVASKNSFSSNRTIVDRTAFARNIYAEIDEEMQKAYWKYGFIPTLNLYLVYRL